MPCDFEITKQRLQKHEDRKSRLNKLWILSLHMGMY